MLAERRPDIAAAERGVAEANEQIGIAKPAFFPTVTLNALFGFESSSIHNFAGWQGFFVGGRKFVSANDFRWRAAASHRSNNTNF
jgi:outer membrane protein TolC